MDEKEAEARPVMGTIFLVTEEYNISVHPSCKWKYRKTKRTTGAPRFPNFPISGQSRSHWNGSSLTRVYFLLQQKSINARVYRQISR